MGCWDDEGCFEEWVEVGEGEVEVRSGREWRRAVGSILIPS